MPIPICIRQNDADPTRSGSTTMVFLPFRKKRWFSTVPGHLLAWRSSWRMVVYIYFITAAGNSVSSQLGNFRHGKRYGMEKAGGAKSHLRGHSPQASRAGHRVGSALYSLRPHCPHLTNSPRYWTKENLSLLSLVLFVRTPKPLVVFPPPSPSLPFLPGNHGMEALGSHKSIPKEPAFPLLTQGFSQQWLFRIKSFHKPLKEIIPQT